MVMMVKLCVFTKKNRPCPIPHLFFGTIYCRCSAWNSTIQLSNDKKQTNKQTEQYTPILLRTEAKEQVVRAWGDGDASRSGVDMQRLCRWSTPYLYDTQLCPQLEQM